VKHIPVLCNEVLALFEGRELRRVLDGTCGGGGHALAILSAHPEIQEYVAVDQDTLALEQARAKLAPFLEKISFCHGNFSEVDLDGEFDAILLDIGVSSFQIDSPERGFSFLNEGPLDMRMDQSQGETAADIVNSWDRKELAGLFWEYGEERASRKIADAIVQARRNKRFSTTSDLVAVIETVLCRRGKIHPATRVFQALRIAVNRELEVLKDSVPKLSGLLSNYGRFAIITFHSLEDRIVKNEFRALSKSEGFVLVMKKPIPASREEQRANKRSRSAKLRCIERNG